MRSGRSPPIEYAHREAVHVPLGKRFAAAVRVKPSNFLCTAAILLLACVLLFRPCSLPVDPTRWQVLSYAQQSESPEIARLMKHELSLSPEFIQASRSCQGDSARLRKFLQKLLRGEAVSVATIGGSVTAGAGTQDAPHERYAERLFTWINETFPHPGHKFVNGGKGGAPSSYIHQCVYKFAPKDADMVLVEFALNDKQPDCGVNTPVRREYEILMRKVMALEHQPAVMALYWWSPWHHRFFQSSQDEMDVIARYYGVPSLSWRDAAYHLMATNASGFTFDEVYLDHGHPNGACGHRYLADMIIAALRNEAIAMLLSGAPWTGMMDVYDTLLPPPMIPGANAGDTECLLDEEFRDLATSHNGWEWKNEGKRGFKKVGWISTTPGSKLLLKINSKRDGDHDIVIGIGFLTSYEHMGMAYLECRSGCECKRKTLQGMIDVKASQTDWVFHSISQHEECILQVSIAKETLSDAHKFKVTSLVITDKDPADKDTVNLFQRVANARTGNVRFDKDGNAIGLIKDNPEPREDNRRR